MASIGIVSNRLTATLQTNGDAETAILTTPPLAPAAGQTTLNLRGAISLSSSGDTAGILLFVHRGGGLAGALVGRSVALPSFDGEASLVQVNIADNVGTGIATQYTVSVIQIGATGAGIVRAAAAVVYAT